MAAGRFLLFVLMLVGTTPIFAQQKIFDEKAWEESRKDLDYNEEVSEPKAKNTDDLPKFNWNANAWASAAKYAFIIVFFGLLLFFLYKYVKTLQSRSSVKSEVYAEVQTLQEAEINPMQTNLLGLIEKLVAEEKYREATRAYFLYVLQRLHKAQKITWKKPKTNFDYVRELAKWPDQQKFKNITIYFERIWYGDQDVSMNEYKDTQPLFAELLAKITDEQK